MQSSHEERLKRARASLEGLSVGDAFGEQWFCVSSAVRPNLIRSRAEPAPVWPYTDDTQMALSIYSNLSQFQEIEQDHLARSFAEHYDPARKYGASMRGLFLKIQDVTSWQEAAASLFEGQGSYGNGAAMRVAPVGAYFADDLARVLDNARRSAEVTHSHSEGIAGAIAVAAATAWACNYRNMGIVPSRQVFLDQVIPFIPESEVRSRAIRAREIDSTNLWGIVSLLGNGSAISAQDTVPFCLWCAGEQLANYEEALWLTASAGGDVDTNCAIVGGIVASYTGSEGIPQNWLRSREPLPDWPFNETRT